MLGNFNSIVSPLTTICLYYLVVKNMHVSRGVFDVEMAVRKLSSRFRHPPQISRPEWPVISATRPLFYMIRLFGLAPFEISEGQFLPGCYSVVYSLCCALAQLYILYFVLIKTLIRRETEMIETIQTVKVVFNCGIGVLNIVMAVWTRKELIGVLNIMKHFDSRIRYLGHPRKEGAAKVWAWSTCVCTVLLWIIVNRTGMVAFAESWIFNMAYLVNYLATSLSTIKFSSVVLLLGQRFRLLNHVAQHSKKQSAMTKQKYTAIDAKVIQQLHNSLMNAGESLCSQYAWPLLLWLMNLCIHSVSNLYFLVDWLMVTPEWAKTRWPLIHCQTWWLITFVAQLLLLHIACHFTSTEANSMGAILVNWKFFAAGRKNYRPESSVHLINRQLNFSAAGCFHVNLPLLSSITGLLTTYLVLLMQFQG